MSSQKAVKSKQGLPSLLDPRLNKLSHVGLKDIIVILCTILGLSLALASLAQVKI